MIAVATARRRPVPPSIHHASGGCTSLEARGEGVVAAAKVVEVDARAGERGLVLLDAVRGIPTPTSRGPTPTAIQSQFQT